MVLIAREVPVIAPREVLETAIEPGRLNCGWFRVLKASALNCNC
jgi:hypothetical protein